MLRRQTDTTARRVCLDAGGNTFMQEKGAADISRALRNYFRPGALGRIHQQGATFSQRKRADQAMGRYLLEFDVLRRAAEAWVIMGGEFSYEFVSVLREQDAALPRNGTSLLQANL